MRQAAGGVCEGGLKFFKGDRGLILLKEKIAELLAGGNNRARGHWEFLDCVFFVGGLSH